MPLILEWDPADQARFRREMNAAADQIAKGLPGAMRAVGQEFASGINLQFLKSGIPQWADLAPYTLLMRRIWEIENNRKVVAGLKTPLRRSDELRLASIATIPGVRGSAYASSALSVQVGPDESELPHAADLQFGDPNNNIPARPFIVLTRETEDAATDAAQDELNIFADRFNSR